ncbi:glycerate kinase [Macrosteles quadrilineatus]|uniref:glycerate kinase n=1 Tax=Macrosteles quadrilineatus TaxID=74068 RepID=UPI0023E1BE5E|nr:glycerate kinase [Macrosteles quadrilineatus]
MIFLSRVIKTALNKRLNSVKPQGKITSTVYLSIMHTSDVQHLSRLVFRKSVLAVNPPDLVQREILVLNSTLHIREQCYRLNKNCYLIGFGKCVLGMASKVEHILGKDLQRGIISVPKGYMTSNRLDVNDLSDSSRISIFEGAENNLPDEGSETASKEIKKLAESLQESDILIVLISGGGSSLLSLSKPPISLREKLEVIKLLGSSGANIVEMNTVRKRLSLVKGGGLASIAYPCKMVALILSDVIGDPLDIIASGPTVGNHDPDDAAIKIIEKYELTDKVSLSVLDAIKRPSDINQTLADHVQNVLIGNNRIALEAASRECAAFGFNPVIITDSISGFVSEVADLYMRLISLLCKLLQEKVALGDFINEINPILDHMKVDKHVKESIYAYVLNHGTEAEKFCLIFGGEPTVKVTGDGLGGRNQELALRIGSKLYEHETNDSDLVNCDVIFLSGGTDGVDGPTNAAGALTYSGQIKHAIEEGIDPQDYLRRNDSHNFYRHFNKGRDLIVTGHTGVNVMDIHLLVVQKKIGSLSPL